MSYFFEGFADELCKLAKGPSEILEESKAQFVPRKKSKLIMPGSVESTTRHLFPIGKQSTRDGAVYETTPHFMTSMTQGNPRLHKKTIRLGNDPYVPEKGQVVVPNSPSQRTKSTVEEFGGGQSRIPKVRVSTQERITPRE